MCLSHQVCPSGNFHGRRGYGTCYMFIFFKLIQLPWSLICSFECVASVFILMGMKSVHLPNIDGCFAVIWYCKSIKINLIWYISSSTLWLSMTPLGVSKNLGHTLTSQAQSGRKQCSIRRVVRMHPSKMRCTDCIEKDHDASLMVKKVTFNLYIDESVYNSFVTWTGDVRSACVGYLATRKRM